VVASDFRPRQRSALEPFVRRLESFEELDPLAKRVGKFVRDGLSQGALKDALSGTWLGHALHPMLTDVVIGSFTSATVLDLTAADASLPATQRLVGLGLLAYLPTAAAGASDWADTEPVNDAVRRVGVIHAGANAVGASLYGASWLARRTGRARAARLLGLAGLGVMATGGYLGGHLSLTRGVGADQTVFDPGPTDWTPAADASLLIDRRPLRVVVDETPVLLVRDGDRIFALHDRCSHRGCSLTEGRLEGQDIVCSCHGSRFALADGALRNGPATSGQPAFQVRRDGDRIEVRRLTLA
jgi:nitrite reductase/ring-hydroxylating ferredoxin subunit/uncharacterized membrane protein